MLSRIEVQKGGVGDLSTEKIALCGSPARKSDSVLRIFTFPAGFLLMKGKRRVRVRFRHGLVPK